MNDQTKTSHPKKTMNGTTIMTTIMTTVFVCAIQSILREAIAVVTLEARIAMVNVTQMDLTGGSRHYHHTFIISQGNWIFNNWFQ